MNSRDVKEIELLINSSAAEKKIDELRARIDAARAAKEKLLAKVKNGGVLGDKDRESLRDYNKEIRSCERQLDRMQATGKQVANTLNNIGGAGVKDLRKTLAALNRELSSGDVERGTEQWKQLQEAIRDVKAEMKAIQDEQKVADESKEESDNALTWWGKKWVGAVSVINTAFERISDFRDAAMEYVQAFADMEEAESQVVKYTGMTKEEVDDLNESFKKMDTRTSREQLNALAGDAGKLGITGKREILEFVDAANQINVALGEDLGSDAVGNIGKMAQLFGDDKTLGLRKAMLATGSAINAVGQASSASEAYLVDFVSRMAGSAKAAGMSQQSLMGYAAVLDESMLRSETSATALQNFMVKLFQEPAKFAKIAGLNVREFTEQMKTDANGAMLSFLQAMKQKGGLADLAPVFDEMKLNGQGAVSVLSVLADRLDLVRERQGLANDAYREADSITQEYTTQNNTIQGQLEKMEQKMLELKVSIGEKLLPVVERMQEMTAKAGGALNSLTGWMLEHKTAVLSFAGTYALLYAALKRAQIEMALTATWTKVSTALKKAWAVAVSVCRVAVVLFTKGVKEARVAMAGLDKVSKTTVFGILATAIAVVAAVFGDLIARMVTGKRRTEELTEAQREQNRVNEARRAIDEQVNKEIAGQLSRVKTLTDRIHDNTAKLEERRAAVEELKKIIPQYNAELDEEGRITRENTAALKAYVKQLKEAAVARAVESQNADLMERTLYWEGSKGRNETGLKRVRARLERTFARFGVDRKEIDNILRKYADAQRDTFAEAFAGYENLRGSTFMKFRQAAGEDYRLLLMYGRNVKNVSGQLGSLNRQMDSNIRIGEELKKQYAKETDLDTAQGGGKGSDGEDVGKAEIEALKQKAEEQLEALSEAEAKGKKGDALRKKIEEYDRRLEVYSAKKTAAAGKRTATAAAKAAREEERERKADNKQKEADIKAEAERERTAALEAYATGQTDYEQYRDRLLEIDQASIDKRRKLYKAGDDGLNRVREDQQELEEKKREEHAELQLARIDEENRRTKAKAAEAYYEGKTSEEQYQQALDIIELEHLRKRAEYLRRWGSPEEAERAQTAYQEELDRQKEAREQAFLERVKQLRDAYTTEPAEKRMEMELAVLDEMHRRGLVKEAEYQSTLAAIRKKGAEEMKAEAAGTLSRAGYEPEDGGTGGGDLPSSLTGGIRAAMQLGRMAETQERLKQMLAENLISYEQYTAALDELDRQRAQTMVGLAQNAFSAVNALMGAASQYAQAASAAEQAKVSARYDAEIKAAGENSRKGKKLQEEKEIAKIKNKYNRKAMKMQIAQAIASTAQNALQAYGAMVGIPVVGPTLAVIAAAAAVAAGMLQVAAIKKQAEAQSEGYYEGGFTGGNRYRREAGVVHEGEFVANHRAVENPAVLPVLELIDRAQRSNTVGSLTREDVSRAVGVASPALTGGGTTAAPGSGTAVVAVERDPETALALRRLSEQLDRGLDAFVVMDEFDKSRRHWERLRRNGGN